MKFRLTILSLILFIAFSCSSAVSDMETDETDSSALKSQPAGKPVIALFPVVMDQSEPVAQTLGEAFSGELSGLLDSMQTYDVRSVPPEYSLEDLTDRLYDNVIQAEVKMESDGGLSLQTRVLDARNGEELAAINETTYDYLGLFPLAEKMVSDMVEDFYGEHIALAELQVKRHGSMDADEEVYLFVDGMYREMDEKGSIQILEGTHEILIMGRSEQWVFFRENLEFTEGKIWDITVNHVSEYQLLFKGQTLGFRVDGNPSEWEWVETALEDQDTVPVEDPAMDFRNVKLISDSEKLYGLAEFAGPFNPASGQFVIQFVPDLKPHSSFTINNQTQLEDPLSLSIYARGQSVDANGTVARRGNYLEFSLDWEDIALYEDISNRVKISTHYGFKWTEMHEDTCYRQEKIMLSDDPTPMLAWVNRDWQPGTDGARAQFHVPFNLISPDGDPTDWYHVPLVASAGSGSGSSLKLIKTAVDEEFFYLFLQSWEEWNKKIPVIIELDQGDGEERSLTLNKRKVSLQLRGDTQSLKGDIRYGANFVEVRIPLEELGNPEYCNVMKISQEEGNSLPVVPYY